MIGFNSENSGASNGMQEIKSVADADVAGKRVVVRVDFNVPLKDGKVQNDMRIRAVVPTLELLQQKGAAQITLLTDIGRPHGAVVEELRVAPVAAHLATLTNAPFELKENLRFDPREEEGDESLAKELAELGDVYVNEAFATSHRDHASITGISKFLPAFAGLWFMQEMQNLSAALTPPKNSVAIIGGAKFETKQPLLEKLIASYGEVLLGGALGNDVIKARGMPFGASLVSELPVPLTLATSPRLSVAHDLVVKEGGENAERIVLVNDIRAVEKIIDIGPDTASQWAQKIAAAAFVLWNGPMGIYEDGYTTGTDVLADALVKSGVKAVVGGGDTIAALAKYPFDTTKVFISTGGGAMLQYLSDGTLPGIEALKNSH